MEITLTLGAVVLLFILIKAAKPNFFNFGTINNHYHGADQEKLDAGKPAEAPGRISQTDRPKIAAKAKKK